LTDKRGYAELKVDWQGAIRGTPFVAGEFGFQPNANSSQRLSQVRRRKAGRLNRFQNVFQILKWNALAEELAQQLGKPESHIRLRQGLLQQSFERRLGLVLGEHILNFLDSEEIGQISLQNCFDMGDDKLDGIGPYGQSSGLGGGLIPVSEPAAILAR
jgi:hypothetical protein